MGFKNKTEEETIDNNEILFSELTDEEKIENLNPNKLDGVDLLLAIAGGLLGGITSCFIKGIKLESKKNIGNVKNTKLEPLATKLKLFIEKNLSEDAIKALNKNGYTSFNGNFNDENKANLFKRLFELSNNPLISFVNESVNTIAEAKKILNCNNPEEAKRIVLDVAIRIIKLFDKAVIAISEIPNLSEQIKTTINSIIIPDDLRRILKMFNLNDKAEEILDSGKEKTNKFIDSIISSDNFSVKAFIKNSIPTILTDLFIRISYAIKSYKEGRKLDTIIPLSIDDEKYPKLSTMMLLAYGISVIVNSAKCAFKKNILDIDLHQWAALTNYMYVKGKYIYETHKKIIK